MSLDEQVVPNKAELVAQAGNCRTEILPAGITSTGEMALDEPTKHPAGGAPKGQFRGLEMKIHRHREILMISRGYSLEPSTEADSPSLVYPRHYCLQAARMRSP